MLDTHCFYAVESELIFLWPAISETHVDAHNFACIIYMWTWNLPLAIHVVPDVAYTLFLTYLRVYFTMYTHGRLKIDWACWVKEVLFLQITTRLKYATLI